MRTASLDFRGETEPRGRRGDWRSAVFFGSGFLGRKGEKAREQRGFLFGQEANEGLKKEEGTRRERAERWGCVFSGRWNQRGRRLRFFLFGQPKRKGFIRLGIYIDWRG